MKNLIFITVLFLTNLQIYAAPQGNSFTYQGELIENGTPANGNYEFETRFYDAATNGTIIVTNFNIAATVTNGIFTIPIDIGDGAFDGSELWLELLVAPAGGTQVTLQPRQLITNSPYSIQAKFVGEDGVSTAALENAAVTTAKITSSAVTSLQIANGTIVAADIDNSSVQQRITGTCAAGSSIRVIAADGTVTCENDDTSGTAGWGLTGNSGSNPTTDFMGTTDDKKLVFKVNNTTAIQIIPNTSRSESNMIMGSSTNSISPDAYRSMIGSGQNNSIETGAFPPHDVVIAGGENNRIFSSTVLVSDAVISGGRNNLLQNSFATIGGGVDNIASGAQSTISGGWNNVASGSSSTVPGGKGNIASNTYSFAAGFGSQANHRGSFVWNDNSDNVIANSLATTADNQFLIRAEGGVGIGTNAPVSPFHIVGEGTSVGSQDNSNEVVMTIEPKTLTNDVALVINKRDTSKEAALIFSTNSQPEFDIRTVNGGALDFKALCEM